MTKIILALSLILIFISCSSKNIYIKKSEKPLHDIRYYGCAKTNTKTNGNPSFTIYSIAVNFVAFENNESKDRNLTELMQKYEFTECWPKKNKYKHGKNLLIIPK